MEGASVYYAELEKRGWGWGWPALAGDLCEQAKYVPIASAATRGFVSLGGGICTCQFLRSVVS